VRSLDIVAISLTVAMLAIALFPDPWLIANFVTATADVVSYALWIAFGLSLGVLASSSVLLAVQPVIEYAVERCSITSKVVAVVAISSAVLLAYYLYWSLRALSASAFYDIGFFVGVVLALPWKREKQA